MIRFHQAIASALCALGVVAAFSAPAVQARTVHRFETTFGSTGSGPGQFLEPAGIAVNNATGNVYVVDRGNERVQELTAAGVPIGEFNGSAAPGGPFVNPRGIAVDNSGNPLDPSSGDVYVIDEGRGVIDKFSEAGTYLGQITGARCPVTQPSRAEELSCGPGDTLVPFEPRPRGPVGITVTSDGTLWVEEFGRGEIFSFSDEAANSALTVTETQEGRSGTLAFAVDAGGRLYKETGTGDEGAETVEQLSPTGQQLTYPFGAVHPTSDHVLALAADVPRGSLLIDAFKSVEVVSEAGSTLESFGEGHLTGSAGLAVDWANGTVFAADREVNDVAVFQAFTLPTVALSAPSEQSPHAVTLNGSVAPEGRPVSSCAFEWATASEFQANPTYTHTAKCQPESLGSGTAPVPVSVRLPELVPGTLYHYRLVASNPGGASETPDSTFTAGPVLGRASLQDVSASAATVEASVDPNGADTHYYLEYGPTTGYGSFAPLAPPGVDLGALPGARSIVVHLPGLSAGSPYHLRLVASQDGELFDGPDLSFETQRAGSTGQVLADNRAWEMVSPPVKGALIGFPSGYAVELQAAADGSGLSYATFGQLGENPRGHTSLSHVLATRTASGWRSQDISAPTTLPPEEENAGEILSGGLQYGLFTPDLEQALLQAPKYSPPLSPEVSGCTPLYIRTNATGVFTPLLTPADLPPETNPCAEKSNETTEAFAATPDLRHFVLRSVVPLTSVNNDLSVWSEGQLLPLALLPNGEPYAGTISLAGMNGEDGGLPRAMSADGRWVAWTAGSAYDLSQHPAPLYLRDTVEGKTVQLGGPHAHFQAMSSDGSKVFFLEGGDLFEFNTGSDLATDLTAKHGSGETSAGVQEFVSDVSEDGRSLYFIATGVLAEGAVLGQPNLYLLQEAEGVWSARFIATLAQRDEPSWHAKSFGPELAGVTSRVSADGRYLAFMSSMPLTGYDNRDAVSGQPDEEVFLYDSSSGRLACVSCNPTGARPHGVLDNGEKLPLFDPESVWNKIEGMDVPHWIAGDVPGWDEGVHGRDAFYQPRYLLGNGRLFFNSPDALVPQATNGVTDVYEFEPAGVGSCALGAPGFHQAEGGCVSLISAGTSSSESAFYDASESGEDVFFITSSRLVPEDTDTAYDVYDAHVCSSAVPCHVPSVAPPPCDSGDSCKPAPSPQPLVFGAPASQTFAGPGNVGPPPAATPAPKPKAAPSRAAQRTQALKACKRKYPHSRSRRARCERQVRARYASRPQANRRTRHK